MATKRAPLITGDTQYSATQMRFLLRYMRQLEERLSTEAIMREAAETREANALQRLDAARHEADELRATVAALEARLAHGRRTQRNDTVLTIALSK